MVKSEVWAGKVDVRKGEVTDIPVYLGEIEFSSLKEAFIKTIRMYNKNAAKHIYNPQFRFEGRPYFCWEYGVPSKNGMGWMKCWALDKCRKGNGVALYSKGPSSMDGYYMTVPKSKVNLKDAVKYVKRGPYL